MAHHAAVPIAIVVDQELSDAAKITAAWLCSFANAQGAGHVSLETIALLMDVEPRQVQKKFKELIDRGHAIKKKGARNEFGEWVRGYEFVYRKTSLKDVIAARKAALRDVFSNSENVLTAPQKRPLRVKKTSFEAAPLKHRYEHRNEQEKERGSRLTADAVLSDDWKSWANAERPDLDPETVFSNFRDYWTAIPGARGRKTDWRATWCRWVRREKNGTGDRKGSAGSAHRNGWNAVIVGGDIEDI